MRWKLGLRWGEELQARVGYSRQADPKGLS